jgi:peptide/nickel transport system substrate-binding protein
MQRDTSDQSPDGMTTNLRRRGLMRLALASGFAVPVLGGFAGLDAAMTRALAATGAPTGTLTFANAEPPTSNYWDPAAGFGLVDEQVASLVHDTLLAFDAKGTLNASIATAWKRLSPTTVEATIRTDAKFHDGSPVTAEDIKASFDRLGQGKLAQSIVVVPGISVTIKTPTSIEIVSPEPFGVIENAMGFVKILRKADIDKPDNFKKGAMGSGPYKFVSYQNNDVVLAANPDYWGGAPKTASIVFRYIEDHEARLNALLGGQVDILTRVSAEDVKRVKGNSGFGVLDISPPAQIIAIVQHNGPFANTKLRQAIAYAVDRKSIADSIMGGVNPVGFSSLPTNVPFYEPLRPDFAYDPDKATALVKEAGFPNGVDVTMATTTLVPNQLEIDQAIAASLEQVGIRVKIQRLEVGAFRSSYNTYDISLNTLATFNDDADFLLGLYTGGAAAAIWHYKDDAFVKLQAAQRAATGTERQAAVTAAASHLWDDQVTLYLSDERWHTIVASRVKDYTRAPLVGERLAADASVT